MFKDTVKDMGLHASQGKLVESQSKMEKDLAVAKVAHWLPKLVLGVGGLLMAV